MGTGRVRGEKYTLAVDFDGVIHAFDTPWTKLHVIHDGPVPGAIEWLSRMVQHFEVVIHSTRCKTWRGRRAIRQWLRTHAGNLMYDAPGYIGLEAVKLTYKKIAALIYLDDRAVRFTGSNFPTKDEIHKQLRPWNRPKGERIE